MNLAKAVAASGNFPEARRAYARRRVASSLVVGVWGSVLSSVSWAMPSGNFFSPTKAEA